MTKPIKERKRRSLLTKALEKLHRPKTPPPVEEVEEEKPPTLKSGTLSHEKPASRRAVRYNPMTAPNSKMIDMRGREYQIGPKGQLRKVQPSIQRTARVDKLQESFREKRKKEKGTGGEKV